MTSKALDFKCAIITGGYSGLGRALSEYFISLGKKVILVGRSEDKARSVAEEIGAAGYYVLDTGDIPSIAPFVAKVTADHPDVDCLVNNAGVQRPLKVQDGDPQDFLSKADQEININIRGPMHLAIGLLGHFKGRQEHGGGAVIVNVASVLGYNPFSIINPVYNATKAWVHFWSMNLRTQLKGTGVRVVEVAPPTVATDLHRERSDPDDNKKENNPDSLTVEEFMDYTRKGFEEDRDVIGAGMSQKVVERWYNEFGADYEKAAAAWK